MYFFFYIFSTSVKRVNYFVTTRLLDLCYNVHCIFIYDFIYLFLKDLVTALQRILIRRPINDGTIPSFSHSHFGFTFVENHAFCFEI
jgi:hypothetical protein